MYSENAIEVSDLSKRYLMYSRPQDRLKEALRSRWDGWRKRPPHHYANEFWALKDINFEVKKGETLGIIGHNGSGKSTLLQLICGTLTPTTGAVQTAGRVAALLELGAGFNPEFSGHENVYLNASLLGLSREEIDERFDRIAAFADIGDFIKSPVKTYSSGMFARLAFAVAIHTDPEILIVDEILAVGDAAFQRRCMKKFYEIRDSGCTILFVSHDQYQVKSICQRALYLDHGRQKMFGQAGTVIDAYMVAMESALTAAEQAAAAPAQPEGESGEAAAGPEADRLYRITDVTLVNEAGEPTSHVRTGETVRLSAAFETTTEHVPSEISFVFNLYRHDGLYLCGSTTKMDGLDSRHAKSGRFSVTFPDLPLLSGKYKWRVAINDGGGFYVYADAKDVCEFTVSDDFDAVGLLSLKREWTIDAPAVQPERAEHD